jgi:hypothetical protein
VLGLACQLQPAAAGASQGVFAVLARQPLMQLHVDRQAVNKVAQRLGSSAAGTCAATARRPPSSSTSTRLQADSNATSSLFAVKLLSRAMAVLTLSYDGACRLHSLVEGGAPGGVSCCWCSPTGSAYTAMDMVEAAGQQEHQVGYGCVGLDGVTGWPVSALLCAYTPCPRPLGLRPLRACECRGCCCWVTTEACCTYTASTASGS